VGEKLVVTEGVVGPKSGATGAFVFVGDTMGDRHRLLVGEGIWIGDAGRRRARS